MYFFGRTVFRRVLSVATILFLVLIRTNTYRFGHEFYEGIALSVLIWGVLWVYDLWKSDETSDNKYQRWIWRHKSKISIILLIVLASISISNYYYQAHEKKLMMLSYENQERTREQEAINRKIENKYMEWSDAEYNKCINKLSKKDRAALEHKGYEVRKNENGSNPYGPIIDMMIKDDSPVKYLKNLSKKECYPKFNATVFQKAKAFVLSQQ